MTIEEYTGTSDIEEQVEILTSRGKDIDIDDLKDAWDVTRHKVIADKTYLPDKEIKDENGVLLRMKPVNRIAVPFQKTIVNKAVVFGFGNEVTIESNAEEGSKEEMVEAAVKAILADNKMSSFDRRLARETYRSTEAAELWYYVKTEPHEDYGFTCNFKVKSFLLSPWKSEKLHPHFNDYGDLVAFARSYVVTNREGEPEERLEAFTAAEYKRYIKAEDDWTEAIETDPDGQEKPVHLDLGKTLKKIPVVYATQEQAEWQDVQTDIDRLEMIFSRHAEINDYHAAPKTFIRGNLTSMPQAGEAGGVLSGGPETDIKILSWKDSPDSIKLEIENMLANIQKFTQTPDISFENIKGMGQISGVMLRMLFMDAHIKVLEKREIWDEYFTRRYNILKAYVGTVLDTSLADAAKKVKLEPIFTPFMVDDQKEIVEALMTANGNKSLISQEKSIELSGLTSNSREEWIKIQEEAKQDSVEDMFPGA